MKDIIIREKKGKAIEGIVIGIFLTLLSIYVLVVGLVKLKVIITIVGLLSVVISISALMFIIKSIKNNSLLLVIGEEGINDMSTLSSIGLIPWQDIKSIEIQTMFATGKFIGIDVYDLDKIMKRSSLFSKINMKLSIIFKYAPLCIRVSTAEIDINTVLLLMQKKLEEDRAR